MEKILSAMKRKRLTRTPGASLVCALVAWQSAKTSKRRQKGQLIGPKSPSRSIRMALLNLMPNPKSNESRRRMRQNLGRCSLSWI